MDELSILKARVAILERQMKKTNAQLYEAVGIFKDFVEAFKNLRRYSRPFIPQPEEKDD